MDICDGCFYYNKKRYIRNFAQASCYEQDWTLFEDLAKELNIGYEVKRNIIKAKGNKKESRYSIFRINNNTIINLGEFIYADYDGIGLKRKYNKYLELKDSYDIRHHKPKIGQSKKIIINGVEYKSIIDASKSLGIYRGTIRKRLKLKVDGYKYLNS